MVNSHPRVLGRPATMCREAALRSSYLFHDGSLVKEGSTQWQA